MVDIVDEKTMKPNETSLGGNKVVFEFCACGGGGWRIASYQIYIVPMAIVLIKVPAPIIGFDFMYLKSTYV